MVIAQQPEYRSSVDDQTINSSKPSNKSKNSVHLSATSTSDSMDPPPPAPPPMSSATSGGRTSSPNSNSTGEKKRRPEPPSPVLLRIDASAQGFHSGGNSPLESSPISFQVAQSGAGHNSYPGGVPVQVTARFASPKAPRPNSSGGNSNSNTATSDGHTHHQSHYHQQNSYHHQPQHYHPQVVPSPAAPATFVAMPGQTTILPVFTSTAPSPALPPQQATHYYTGHPQAAFPTMVPFHMPGSYAVAGYTPAIMHNTAAGVGVGAGNIAATMDGDVMMDPMMASHYQAVQYNAMVQQFMQHNLNMQQQQQQQAMGNVNAVGGGGGNRHRGGSSSSAPPSPYYQSQYQPNFQTHNQAGGGGNMGYSSSSYHHQPSGGNNGNRYSSGSMNSSYSNTYPMNNTSSHNSSTEIALPGVSDGPEAEVFQAAIRESGALSSYDRSSSGGGAGGGSGSGGGGGVQGDNATNEFLLWVRKTLVTLDAGGGGNSGAPSAHNNVPPSSTNSSSLVLTLEEMRGNIVALSRDQIGSRVLQTAMEGMNEDDLKLLFEELCPKLEILMADQFGNYVIQRLLESRVESIVISIGESLQGRVLPFALHVYGCRVVQKALEALPQEHRVALAVELQPFTLHCLSDQNANHVIQKCLETVQPSDGIRGMLETIGTHALTLARHSFGCRAVQRLLQYCSLTEIYDKVIDDVLSSILELTKNQFGNYVVQHLVAQGPEETRNAIMEVILPLASSLACHKFASNVMETCLQQCPEDQRSALIEQFLHPSDPQAPTVAGVARDQFGNYVLQRALEVATEEEKWHLVEELQPHLEGLRRSGYGKHIAARVGKMMIGMPRQKPQQVEHKDSVPAAEEAEQKEENSEKEKESAASVAAADD